MGNKGNGVCVESSGFFFFASRQIGAILSQLNDRNDPEYKISYILII